MATMIQRVHSHTVAKNLDDLIRQSTDGSWRSIRVALMFIKAKELSYLITYHNLMVKPKRKGSMIAALLDQVYCKP